jgi:hopanoid biosynthesis associated RND transporter like protein HpnN
MKPLEKTVFGRWLGRLAELVLRKPHLFVWPQLVLAAVCVGYTALNLQFDTNRDNLVGSDRLNHRNFLQFKKEFPEQDDLVVVVESDAAEQNRQFVERVGAKLEAETNLFTDVFYKGDLKMMGRKALLFVPEDDLAQMQTMLRDYTPFIRQFAQTTNLTSFFEMVNTQFRTAKQEENAQNDSLINALPALRSIVAQADQSLVRAGVPPSPGVTALFGGGDEAQQQIYITFERGRIYLCTAHARRDELNPAAVEEMRRIVEQTRAEVPGVNAGITGEPVLEHDEMEQSQRDTAMATVVALVLSALIFIYGYQETGRPVKATLCLLVGLAYTMGFATLVIGHLNLLTITFLPMLIGLAIDYGVHLVTRYEEELRHGRTAEAALKKAMIFTGQGIFTGAFTTAGAFLAMWFTGFKGIQEMGLISGGGLAICLVPMLTMLPVLLLRGRQNVIDHTAVAQDDARRARIERLWLERPGLVTALTLGLCALALTQFPKVHFDYDLLDMQSAGLPAVTWEKKLIASAQKSVLFAAVVADTPQEAVQLEAKIKTLPVVSDVDSISRFLTQDQRQQLQLVSQIKQEVAGIRFAEIDPGSVDIPGLSRTLWSLQGYLGLAAEEVGTNDPALRQQLARFHDDVVDFRKRMLGSPPDLVADKLGDYQRALLQDMQDTFAAIRDQDDRQALQVQDLPATLRNRFVGVTGKYLLQVYPKKDVWQRPNQVEFIGQLRRALDPNHTNHPIITGTPVQLLEYTTLLKQSYQTAAWYSLAAIVLLVLIHFRNLSSVVLALVPVAVGSIWLGGIMGFLHIPFNPANIMTLPLVIGIGVTNGIHILNRYAEEKTPNIFAKSTGKAVLVSGLTTIAGFGSLILAKHQGIKSLGCVMATGVAMCMLAGLTFLPALLNLWFGWGQKGRPSANNARSATGSGGTEANLKPKKN